MAALQLEVLDCGVQIECIDEDARALLQNVYRSFKRPITQTRINYHVTPGLAGSLFIARHGACPEIARGPGDFICKFDKDLIIETQKLRPDLYFVHAAVVAFRERAIALVAPSGFGKSTTTWALLHHSFQYLSDEIAPIEPRTFRVLPFPRALCLKKTPPGHYPLPPDAVVTGRTIYVPTSLFSGDPVSKPLPLSMIFFLRFLGETQPPILKPMSSADAAVRLLINTLNPLAHPEYGLDNAVAIAANTPCFELLTGDVHSTCELVRATCVRDFSHAGTRLDSSAL
jgi:hypothetical protein